MERNRFTIIESNRKNFGLAYVKINNTPIIGCGIEHQPWVNTEYLNKMYTLADTCDPIFLSYFPADLNMNALKGNGLATRVNRWILEKDGVVDFFGNLAKFCANKQKTVVCPDFFTGHDFYFAYLLTRVIDFPFGIIAASDEWRSTGYFSTKLEESGYNALYRYVPDVEVMRNMLVARAISMWQMDRPKDTPIYIAPVDHVKHVLNYVSYMHNDKGGKVASLATSYSQLGFAPPIRVYKFNQDASHWKQKLV